MSTLQAFQNELLTQVYDYMRFVQEKTQADNNYERVYSIAQVNSLTILIDQSPTTVELFNSVSRYIEVNLPRPFGERMRYRFGMRERTFDLHNNLKWLLEQEKYKHFILQLIDNQAEMKRQHTEDIRLMQESFKLHPEVVTNSEIISLKKANAELITRINDLEAQLRQMQQERDYWRSQYNIVNTENVELKKRNKEYEEELNSFQEENNDLKQKNTANFANQTNAANAKPRSGPQPRSSHQ